MAKANPKPQRVTITYKDFDITQYWHGSSLEIDDVDDVDELAAIERYLQDDGLKKADELNEILAAATGEKWSVTLSGKWREDE